MGRTRQTAVNPDNAPIVEAKVTAEDAVPEGTLTEIKSLYLTRDKDGNNQWVVEYPKDAIVAAENGETLKYALLVRNKISTDSRKTLEIDSIIVQSQYLKDALDEILVDYPGITCNLKRLVFRAPFKPFVHRWLDLVAYLKDCKDETTKSHLQLFHDVLFEELKDEIATKNDLVSNGVITFKHLWTIFEPGCLMYGTDYGHERAYEVVSADYTSDQFGREFLRLYSKSVDYDGSKFGSKFDYVNDYEFEGTKSIIKLSYFPLDFHPHKEKVMERLLARGKIFEKYAGYHFEAYKGVALGYGRCGMIKHSVDSRIIIDCAAHNRFLPNRAVTYQALCKAVGGQDDMEDYDSQADVDEDEEYYSDADSEGFIHTSDTESKNRKHRELTKNELLLCVQYVRGFATRTKTWLWFFLPHIRPITFNSVAFNSLVLPSHQKELIKAFVEAQVKHKDEFDDVIQGKGRGMILLLSGPPGVGKTLTAESVAENMRVPLYTMSAGDLGLDPSGIEETLTTILEMVAKWNAVLLLDEADVFLEARSPSDLERNKMVSIFLRMLEYYEGILFLTTNRVRHIDDAFHSRIHISMQYPALNAAGRRQIWKTFVGESAGLSEGELDALAEVELNGRQIKNVLKTARLLAKTGTDGKEGEEGAGKVMMSHVQTILAIERWNAKAYEQ